MSRFVLDASALLAMVNGEPGDGKVASAVTEGAAISAVNLSEVVAKLNEAGMLELEIREALGSLGLDVIDLTSELAYRVGLLRPITRRLGLSLGDRSCLALAQRLGLPVLTTDRAWLRLQLGIPVQVIR